MALKLASDIDDSEYNYKFEFGRTNSCKRCAIVRMSCSAGNKRRLDVVSNVFPKAITLLEYCKSVIDSDTDKESILLINDSIKYKELLQTSLILPPIEARTLKFKIDKQGHSPVREIIARLVSQIVRSNQPYHEQNCLALGYRLKTSNSDVTMRSNIDTELFCVNTIQAILNTQPWQILANRIGKVNMMKPKHSFSEYLFPLLTYF